MGQLFAPWANTVARLSLVGAVVGVVALGGTLYAIFWSPYMTNVGVPVEQPVQFSHDHHVSGLGIDCRYCHTAVEKSASAGIPPTRTCMTCHSQVWTEAPILAPIRQSLIDRQPVRWNRVHDLPDFVFFNHSIHVNKGVGCTTCHGPVGQMPLMRKTHSLYMKWCLECHRAPERFLRPKSEIYSTTWQAPADQNERGRDLVRVNGVRSWQRLSECSICHR